MSDFKGVLYLETGMAQNWVRIPPARFLDIRERLFSPKRFQRDGGVATTMELF
jgi:hypothetical protein